MKVAATVSLLALTMTAAFGLATGRAAARSTDPVRVVAVEARKFAFVPDRIEATQGETVRLVVRSSDGEHGIAIKRFKVDKYVPPGGTPAVVEFKATEAGSFPFECSEYCGRGHAGMKGVLVVAPAGR